MPLDMMWNQTTYRLNKSTLRAAGLALALCAAAAAAAAANEASALMIPPSGVIGVDQVMLNAGYWIARTPAPNKLLLSPQQIATINARTASSDPMMRDLANVGPSLPREQVQAWLKEIAFAPDKVLVQADGAAFPKAELEAMATNAGAEHIPAAAPTRYGLAVRRTPMRFLPTTQQAYPLKGLTDYDSFQAGVLVPGDAIVIAHESVDGKWLFVYTTQGPAWVARGDIGLGKAGDVLSYGNRKPYVVVTGDKVNTVFTPEAPEVSEVLLDMGTRVPLAQLPPGEPVNGAGPYVSWTIDLPVRRDDGSLAFEPALLQKAKDTSPDYLPLTRANIIRQSFKLLGERYGWGGAYNARDCSGFSSAVYRSMGILLSPNTGAQGNDPALKHQLFTAADSHEARVKAVMQAQVGDLLVVPGHVLMILGHVNGQPYVIQDVPYAVFHDPSGNIRMTKVNEVSVTALLPLMADGQHTYVDAMTSLVHVTAK